MPDLDQLLERTSRTFALSIPLLPEPTRREVTLAYLLFRIADTFEDAARWPREQRIAALEDFSRLLEDPTSDTVGRLSRVWVEELPLEHEGYLELLRETPYVLEEFSELSPRGRELVKAHTQRTAHGMAGFVSRTGDDGELRLDDLQDLRDYCYVVAGIVGEMLTELFLLGRDYLTDTGPFLRARARLFGEALQLVNILKDSAFDVKEGRVYLPEQVARDEVFALAREDLEAATEYTLALQRAGAERGLVAFNALPALLAWATLEKVEEEGPGAKISRDQLWSIVAEMEKALDEDRPVIERAGAEQAEQARAQSGA
jgi:farnesyl-diphosphate farnesyltransferase